jgi:PIN domain nuclease of toxin-antitoxin system
MKLLLDTHALIWWLAGDSSLAPRARAAIGDTENQILVSAASAMEICTKYRLGKLPDAGPLATELPAYLAAQGFIELPISLAHAALAGSLTIQHKDPFDRFLIAQSLIEGLPLVSNEAPFDHFGVTRLWD